MSRIGPVEEDEVDTIVSVCVCAKCKQRWQPYTSPSRCPACGKASFSISIDKSSARKAEIGAKISAALKGRHPSDETRAKLSAATTGRHPSDETRAKLSAAATGKHQSDETRDKISSAKMRQT